MKKSIKVNAFFNVMKQCCSVIFPLITYPYISRVLGSGNLGRYSFADSVVQYFLIFAGLGISTYGIRESSIIKDDKIVLNKLAAELFSINCLSTILSLTLLYLSVICIPRFRDEKTLILLMSLNVIFTLIGRDWVNTVFEDFKYLSIRYIVLHIISLILIFTFIKSPNDIVKYAIICIFAVSGGYIANVFYTNKLIPLRITNHINLKKHFKPILLLFCSTVAINIYIHSDITLLGFFRTNEEIGYYSVASRIYITIKGVLNAIIVVTIPRLSNYVGNKKFYEYNKLLDTLRSGIYTLMIPTVVGLFILSDDVLLIVGGTEYGAGTEALRILSIALFFAVFGCFYTQGILVPCKRERVFTYATVISALVNISLNLIMIPKMGINGAAFTTLIAEALILTIAKYKSGDIGLTFENKELIGVAVGCISIVVSCILTKSFNLGLAAEMMMSVLLSGVSYAFILYKTNNSLMEELIMKVRGELIKKG